LHSVVPTNKQASESILAGGEPHKPMVQPVSTRHGGDIDSTGD